MEKENNQEEYSVKPFLDRINLIFHGILALPILAFAWFFLESNAGNLEPMVGGTTFGFVSLIVPVFILGICTLSFLIFRRKLTYIDEKLELSKKLESYYHAALIMFAGLEGALVLSIVGFFLTLSNTFTAMFVIVLVFFSLIKPTPNRIANHLRLEGEERDIVMNRQKN